MITSLPRSHEMIEVSPRIAAPVPLKAAPCTTCERRCCNPPRELLPEELPRVLVVAGWRLESNLRLLELPVRLLVLLGRLLVLPRLVVLPVRVLEVAPRDVGLAVYELITCAISAERAYLIFTTAIS